MTGVGVSHWVESRFLKVCSSLYSHHVSVVLQLIFGDITDSKDFPGSKFTQEHVAKALRYGLTTLTEDRKMFKPNTLHLFPKVSAWLDDPDGKYDLKFGSMMLKAFHQYLNETRAEGENSRMRKGKKNARVMSDDESQSSGKGRGHVNKKGKFHRVDSDDLDD
jgi:hypothetical protein